MAIQGGPMTYRRGAMDDIVNQMKKNRPSFEQEQQADAGGGMFAMLGNVGSMAAGGVGDKEKASTPIDGTTSAVGDKANEQAQVLGSAKGEVLAQTGMSEKEADNALPKVQDALAKEASEAQVAEVAGKPKTTKETLASLLTKIDENSANAKEQKNQQKLVMALTAILPTIAGYALGGAQGGAIGAGAGAKGVEMIGDQQKQDAKDELETLKNKAAIVGQIADVEDKERSFKLQEAGLEKQNKMLEEQLRATKQSEKLASQKFALEYQKYLADLNSNKAQFDKLPKENQQTIEKLANDSSTQLKIKAILDETVKQMDDPNITEDMKISIGKDSIKALNSVIGSDAAGKEEVERIGSRIQNRYNLIGEGPVRAGRPDIEGFTEQLRNKSKNIAGTLQTNYQQIEVAKSGVPLQQLVTQTPEKPVGKDPFAGRGPGLGESQAVAAPVPTPPPKPHPQDSEAVKWAEQNKNSKDAATKQKAQQILQLNGVK